MSQFLYPSSSSQFSTLILYYGPTNYGNSITMSAVPRPGNIAINLFSCSISNDINQTNVKRFLRDSGFRSLECLPIISDYFNSCYHRKNFDVDLAFQKIDSLLLPSDLSLKNF